MKSSIKLSTIKLRSIHAKITLYFFRKIRIFELFLKLENFDMSFFDNQSVKFQLKILFDNARDNQDFNLICDMCDFHM